MSRINNMNKGNEKVNYIIKLFDYYFLYILSNPTKKGECLL